MAVYTKIINIPIKDALYEIMIQHDQITDQMMIKVDGVEQNHEKKKAGLFGATNYKVKIGNKNSLTNRFRADEEKVVMVTTKKPWREDFQYSILIDGETIQAYKSHFEKKWVAWKLDANSEERIFLGVDQQNVWMGGRIIGKLNGFENINFAVRNVEGHITRNIKYGEQHFVAFYNNKKCVQLKYDEQEI
ncbi:hypothetical protein CAEBREN_11952 [Caenorhabditis brenneri]|uniref:Uncharacterized protein n=1 Tax=Caenorhabditis brenneri TaxID=135651 RepID=G0MWQ5_CAEBE|nr:hypothetical protein CAEBREN_11952 [Caenorhabditis brenneri]